MKKLQVLLYSPVFVSLKSGTTFNNLSCGTLLLLQVIWSSGFQVLKFKCLKLYIQFSWDQVMPCTYALHSVCSWCFQSIEKGSDGFYWGFSYWEKLKLWKQFWSYIKISIPFSKWLTLLWIKVLLNVFHKWFNLPLSYLKIHITYAQIVIKCVKILCYTICNN